MDHYLLLKWAHVVTSTVLLGTGAGIAFFFLRAALRRDPAAFAATAQDVVIADVIFTATAVVLQPMTGIAMAAHAGYPLSAGWLRGALILYALIGACWLPVVWLQIRMRNLARLAARGGAPLPAAFDRCLRAWMVLGVIAFSGLLAIFWLMIAKPA